MDSPHPANSTKSRKHELELRATMEDLWPNSYRAVYLFPLHWWSRYYGDWHANDKTLLVKRVRYACIWPLLL